MQALQGVVSLEPSRGPQVWVPVSWELGFRTWEGSCALLWGSWKDEQVSLACKVHNLFESFMSHRIMAPTHHPTVARE